MFIITDYDEESRHVCRCHFSTCSADEIASAVADPDFRGDCDECATSWAYGISPNCECSA